MKLPSLFKRTPKPPLSAAQRQVRGYAYIFLGLLALVLVAGRNVATDAVAGSMIFAAAFFVGTLLLHKKPWRRGVTAALIAGALSISGILLFTIVMSALYVARYGTAVAEHEGYGMKLFGLALIAIAHFAAWVIARKRWPDDGTSTRNNIPA